MRNKVLSSFILLLMVFFTVACSDNNENSAEESNDDSSKVSEEESQPASEEQASGPQAKMPEPDLKDIPDTVAEVNGEKISRVEFESTYVGQFQRAAMQAQMTGKEIDQNKLKKQITDALIGQELIVQEAEKNGFEASENAINEEIDSIVKQNKLESKEEYFTAIKEQGMAKEDILAQIEKQLKVDKLITDEAGNIEPSEKELKEVYNNYTDRLKQQNQEGDKKADIPSYEDMEPDLIKQVKANKESKVYQKLVKELEADADITKHL